MRSRQMRRVWATLCGPWFRRTLLHRFCFQKHTLTKYYICLLWLLEDLNVFAVCIWPWFLWIWLKVNKLGTEIPQNPSEASDAESCRAKPGECRWRPALANISLRCLSSPSDIDSSRLSSGLELDISAQLTSLSSNPKLAAVLESKPTSLSHTHWETWTCYINIWMSR